MAFPGKLDKWIIVADSFVCVCVCVCVIHYTSAFLQIVEQIFMTLEILLQPPDTEEGRSKEKLRPEWFSQLLSFLSSSVTLQRSLSILLHHHLSLTDITKQQVCSTD